MRYSRLVIALILSTSLIFTLTVPIDAAEWTFTPNKLFIQYTPIVQDHGLEFEIISFNGSNYISNIQSELYLDEALDDPTHKAQSLGIQYLNSNNNDGSFDFTEGMIYTFSGEFFVTSSATEVFDVGFYLTNLAYSNNISIPNMSIYYTVATRAGRRTVNWEAVVEATDELTSPEFSQFDFISVEFNGSFEGSIRVQNLECSAFDSYGEDAFYDANISALQDLKSTTEAQTVMINDVGQDIVESNTEVKNAIDNMWENEYLYVESVIPDSSADADQVKGGIEAIDLSLKSLYFDELFTVFANGMAQARPVVYMPEIDIPILNIHVMDAGFLYLDSELDNMDPNIMTRLNVLVIFVRWTALITICTVTIYKLYRLEWWT